MPYPLSLHLQKKGILSLSVNTTSVTIGTPITITLLGSSSNEQIVGYDAYINYDKSRLTYTGGDTQINDFIVIKRNATNGIHITGVQKPTSTAVHTFSNTPLFEMKFAAKRPGNTTIRIFYTYGATNRSTLVTNESKNILGEVKPVTITITR